MDRKKRSTLIGAAMIFMGIALGTGLGYLLAGEPEQEISHRPYSTNTGGDTTAVPVGPAPVGAEFTSEDMKWVDLRCGDGVKEQPDLEALLLQPLQWDLSIEEPTVLIVHTHASESYEKQEGQQYEESSDYRTLDTAYNMVAVGDRLAELLEQAGIGVIHDRQIHDHPSYNDAYTNSRSAVEDYLQTYPTIQVVLDLHRDAVLLNDGSQFAPTVTVAGEQVAQLMLIIGSDGSGAEHPLWAENLSAALKLQVLLEKNAPGITRTSILRTQRYNQDLSTGAMLIEVGAAGNTIDEALGAVPILAQALIALMYGAN